MLELSGHGVMVESMDHTNSLLSLPSQEYWAENKPRLSMFHRIERQMEREAALKLRVGPEFVTHSFTDREAMVETNDCTVRALAAVCPGGYSEAHLAFEMLGRRKRKGFNTANAFSRGIDGLLGIKATRLCPEDNGRSRGMGSVRAFLKAHPQGRYVITVARHAMAVIDGRVHDRARGSGLQRIKNAWQID